LPAGKSLYGYMTIFGDGTTIAATSAAFLYPLASVPAVHFIAAGASTPPGCLGDSTNPGAESGNLCIFEFQKSNVVSAGENGPVSDNTADTRGFAVWANGAAAGQFYDKVRWAVTG
jgi:hypothetical protein